MMGLMMVFKFAAKFDVRLQIRCMPTLRYFFMKVPRAIMAGLADLPAEICLILFRLVDQTDLVSLASCCARFRLLTKDQSLWRKLCLDCEVFRSHYKSLCAFMESVPRVANLSITNKQLDGVPDDSIKDFILREGKKVMLFRIYSMSSIPLC